ASEDWFKWIPDRSQAYVRDVGRQERPETIQNQRVCIQEKCNAIRRKQLGDREPKIPCRRPPPRHRLLRSRRGYFQQVDPQTERPRQVINYSLCPRAKILVEDDNVRTRATSTMSLP